MHHAEGKEERKKQRVNESEMPRAMKDRRLRSREVREQDVCVGLSLTI